MLPSDPERPDNAWMYSGTFAPLFAIASGVASIAAGKVRPHGYDLILNENRWKPRIQRLLFFVMAGLGLCTGSSLFGSTLPSGFTESLIVGGLANPTAMQFAPDGRLFVCQQNGQLRVIKNGVLLAAPFLTVSTDNIGERGLLGIAFDPGFASNHWIYIYYTTATPVHNRVSRFTANGDTAVTGSELVILDHNHPSATYHNGGAIHFGSDGKFYIAIGDHGESAKSQTLESLLGKILRINADGTIPTDNPFYNTVSGVNRAIWALGLRNPFTFAVQPGTGRIFINDVGEVSWEEINDAVAGANFGWPNCEGGCIPSNPSYRDPIFRYPHGSGTSAGNAITGGTFYNPAIVQFPASYVGSYFFADYVNGWIRRLDPANGNQVSNFASGINAPVDLKVGPDGRLYYLARDSGSVFAVSATGSQAPQITQQPADQTVGIGQSATFTVAASGTPPLSYQWQRNGANISGATAASYTLSSAGAQDDGAAFRCLVSNASGTATSNPAFLHISNNNPPAGTITLPATGTRYSAGDTIQFAGTASDPEDGTLPASAFSWTVVFHHNTHTHPFLGPINGVNSGSFVIPTQGETSANVWYRIRLTVTDSVGQTQTSFVDVTPRTATISLATIPPGLQVTLDGQPQTTPVSVLSVVGVSRTLGVVSPQTLNGTNYEFASWSDGGSTTHVIATPATDTTYTATYREPPPFIGTITWSNSTAITIPDIGAATPYPSTINVSGTGGTITEATLTLRSLSHSWTRDIDILLVGPAGQNVLVMSDTGSGGANNVTLTLSDTAAAALPSSGLVSGTFRPNNYTDASVGGDNFPNPAPAGPYGTTLSAFSGTGANGVWALYVFDDGNGDVGAFNGGWTLTLTTTVSGQAAPTISDIANQSTPVNTATAAIPVTVNDADTPPESLTLSGSSSNPTLVPPSGIVFGGSGPDRTVAVTPAQGQTGTATITVTVSDGSLSAFDTFVLTVNVVNTAPTISQIADGAIDEDTSTGTIGFTVGDAETAAGSLTVGGSSSNPALVPPSGIVFGGSGANRTVTVTPAANQNGTATITVNVSDGSLSASDTFVLAVNAVNDAPAISDIANRSTAANTPTPAIGFTVGDAETPAGSLILSGSSSNPTLVPNGNVVFGGSGANPTVTVTPAANQSGTATITVSVSDGSLSASDTFVLTVNPPVSGGLVAAYGFNEGVGSTAADASGSANPGTISGAAWTTQGRFGGALSFNGSSSLVVIHDSSSLDLTTAMTLEAWVFPAVSQSGWRTVIQKEVDTYLLHAGSNTPLSPATGATYGGGVVWIPAPGTITVGQWTHLAGTYDGARLRLYVNGVEVAGVAHTGAISVNNQPVRIGGNSPYGEFFNGRIDEVRIYNRALSATEIQNDMNTPVGSGPAPAEVSINPQPKIASVEVDNQGSVILTVTGESGEHYAIESSTDLVNWRQIGMKEASNDEVVFSEPVSSTIRFYRAVVVPDAVER